MAKDFQKYSDITAADITKWKQTKGSLLEESIPLTDEIEGKVAKYVICKPTRNILSAIIEYGKQEDVEKVNELLVTNCVLGGDMIHLDKDQGDVQVYLTMIETLGKLMQPRQTKSKKL